jgi:hypothetical protein
MECFDQDVARESIGDYRGSPAWRWYFGAA